jgi:hypothetical protein
MKCEKNETWNDGKDVDYEHEMQCDFFKKKKRTLVVLFILIFVFSAVLLLAFT